MSKNSRLLAVAFALAMLVTVAAIAAETPVETAPVKPPITADEPARPKSATIPGVAYTKTGDPVTDMLILLDLYEKGKISKDQFEREKALALQKIP